MLWLSAQEIAEAAAAGLMPGMPATKRGVNVLADREGWAHTPPEYVPFPKVTYPTDPTGPDELLEGHWLWPTHKITPFHMNHPVTGKPIEAQRLQRDLDHDAAIAAK